MKHARTFRRWFAALSLMAMTLIASGCSDKLIVLDPKGPVGAQQRDLIYISTALCLIVVVPVLILTAIIVWRYRERASHKAAYEPEWEHNTKLETIWWGIPIVIIAILGFVTVKYTHILEPSRPLASAAQQKPLTIQVTSLDWKWLFYYPEQGIATVNYVQFPEDKPIKFVLTSDAPMNSFWIPQLGGQIYTMSGMAMTLNLQADEPGDYFGSGANFSGKDFAKMRFTARATSQAQFDEWVAGVKSKEPALTEEGYKQLATPGVSEVRSFSSFPKGLFEQTVTKYAASHRHGGTPAQSNDGGHAGHGQSNPNPTKGDGGSTAGSKKNEGSNGHVGQH
ncbi:ubiquinol oxidase subunit II [Paenibacillus flagellatus]|uniref:Quinol oxidase subunit 2 n=1 Tax=Paenibacillus flagellatus TaxID=2211139 RepID=A0A2V5KG61_9BACL|nr:ubiquinol oxidase subunit II [Paenibacillus flagellatus]PYI57243.1 ubiquinol oxidase subunit II [Paenibacillus flagellatus]